MIDLVELGGSSASISRPSSAGSCMDSGGSCDSATSSFCHFEIRSSSRSVC